jgi:dTDP-glucose pyrophosphorylase
VPVSYIICAAGRGSRTQLISKEIAKPLLRLNGKTLLQRALESLPITSDDQVIILHLKELSEDSIKRQLKIDLDGSQIQFIAVSGVTRGQLDTAMLAFEQVVAKNSVCIFNSDTAFACHNLKVAIQQNAWDGLIPCSVESGESWSFCRIGGEASVSPEDVKVTLEVAEKRRISEWCSVGFYWFKSLEILRFAAKKEIVSLASGQETYVAPIYNHLIRQGLKIGMIPVEKFQPMGSVEQIERFWNISLVKIRNENQ